MLQRITILVDDSHTHTFNQMKRIMEEHWAIVATVDERYGQPVLVLSEHSNAGCANCIPHIDLLNTMFVERPLDWRTITDASKG